MNAISRHLSALGAVALVVSLMAGAPLAYAGHVEYPPGWNKPQATGPVIYQMVPQGERYHVVANTAASSETNATK